MNPARYVRLRRMWNKMFARRGPMPRYQLYKDGENLTPFTSVWPISKGHFIKLNGSYYLVKRVLHKEHENDKAKQTQLDVETAVPNFSKMNEVLTPLKNPATIGEWLTGKNGDLRQVAIVIHKTGELPTVYIDFQFN